MKKLLILSFVFLLLSFKFANADQINDRLSLLENILKSMQDDSVQRNEKVASALASVEQVKLDFQGMQGTIDANSHLINEQQAEILRLKRDVADRISSIEERLEIYDMQVTKAVEKVLPKAAMEGDAYQKALDLVHKSDFLTAVASFRNFIKVYPKSVFADNAQYWIGECYYAMRDYAKAIKEFQMVSEQYAGSDKIAAATLKQGFSFAELGMTEEAKPFLNKVLKNYPGSDEAGHAREKLDKLEQKQISAPIATPAGQIPLAPGVAKPVAVPVVPAPAVTTPVVAAPVVAAPAPNTPASQPAVGKQVK